VRSSPVYVERPSCRVLDTPCHHGPSLLFPFGCVPMAVMPVTLAS
jgi:hypothetical protein